MSVRRFANVVTLSLACWMLSVGVAKGQPFSTRVTINRSSDAVRVNEGELLSATVGVEIGTPEGSAIESGLITYQFPDGEVLELDLADLIVPGETFVNEQAFTFLPEDDGQFYATVDGVVSVRTERGQVLRGSFRGRVPIVAANVAPEVTDASSFEILGLGQEVDYFVDALDPGDDELSYEWDLDGDGVFETPGQQGRRTISVRGRGSFAVRISDGDGGVTTEIISFLVPEEGDFDGDGLVGVLDVDRYVGKLGAEAVDELFILDIDGDGFITLQDYDEHVTRLLIANGVAGTELGDINLDGDTTVLGDGFVLISNLGRSDGVSRSQGDLDASGSIDVLGDAIRLIGSLAR